MNSRAIVNLSTLKYAKGQYRLNESLKGNTDADILLFQHESEVGAYSHSANKYGFKASAVNVARDRGYKFVLWLDASMNVIRNIDPIFSEIENTGYFAQDSGWKNSRWTTPAQKKYFGTNEGSMISSGVLGFNFDHDQGKEFFMRWYQAMLDGMFNGSHAVSRHDQTAASLIIEQMGLKITPNNYFWNYGKEPWHENILLLADGIS